MCARGCSGGTESSRRGDLSELWVWPGSKITAGPETVGEKLRAVWLLGGELFQEGKEKLSWGVYVLGDCGRVWGWGWAEARWRGK